MEYYSLKNKSERVSFKTAAITGQAPDRGLYFPSFIPTIDKPTLERFKTLEKAQLAYEVMKPYVGDAIDEESLKEIIATTINFNFPLVSITEQISSLELYHGPTLAFKDVGARFMSRCLGYFSSKINVQEFPNVVVKPSTVLVATSGDTGGAVAHGFLEVKGVNVLILYPKGKVSAVQELQLTTCGKNITALEVDGSFDDCQAMVKDAFMDPELKAAYNLTSANSINVARWLPQQLYYFFAWQQWVAKYGDEVPMNVVVPSGNFGNIGAGLLAKASGLPIGHFIAACNANDIVTRYLQTKEYEVRSSIATVSNAMDVGDPSNFVRIMQLLQNDFETVKNSLSSYRISEEETTSTITRVYQANNYLLDPHGAVAYVAAEKFIATHQHAKAIILETAHPVKFPEVVEKATGHAVAIPSSVKFLFEKEKVAIPMEANFEAFKKWMLR